MSRLRQLISDGGPLVRGSGASPHIQIQILGILLAGLAALACAGGAVRDATENATLTILPLPPSERSAWAEALSVV